jgi:hypothetical protein
MLKNTSGQKIALFAFDYTTGAPKTGDAANITPYINVDWAGITGLTDTSASEISSSNAPGWYLFDVTQGETNGNALHFTAKSSTSNVVIVGRLVFTSDPTISTRIDTIDDFLDTEIAAIKAKTDNLPSDPADQSLIIAATDAIMTRLGAPVGADISADIAGVPDAIGARVIPEDYAADEAEFTLDQITCMIWSRLMNFSFSTTTRSMKKLDKTTEAMTAEIDSETNATEHFRAT